MLIVIEKIFYENVITFRQVRFMSLAPENDTFIVNQKFGFVHLLNVGLPVTL